MFSQNPRLVCQSRVIALDEDTRRVKHVISTARLDRNNRIVDVAGWNLRNFRENPIVVADHEYGIERVIGTAHDTKIEGDALVSTTEFLKEGLGNVAFRLLQAMAVRSWSVGWDPLQHHAFGDEESCATCQAAMKRKKVQYGRHFTSQDLLEYSLVTIPANPDAVMGLQKAGFVAQDEADAWIAAAPAVEVAEAVEEEPEADAPPVRSAEFYQGLYSVSRTFARYAAARSAAQRRTV